MNYELLLCIQLILFKQFLIFTSLQLSLLFFLKKLLLLVYSVFTLRLNGATHTQKMKCLRFSMAGLNDGVF